MAKEPAEGSANEPAEEAFKGEMAPAVQTTRAPSRKSGGTAKREKKKRLVSYWSQDSNGSMDDTASCWR